MCPWGRPGQRCRQRQQGQTVAERKGGGGPWPQAASEQRVPPVREGDGPLATSQEGDALEGPGEGHLRADPWELAVGQTAAAWKRRPRLRGALSSAVATPDVSPLYRRTCVLGVKPMGTEEHRPGGGAQLSCCPSRETPARPATYPGPPAEAPACPSHPEPSLLDGVIGERPECGLLGTE